ncbi:MAG: ABC transporter permease [Deltaproteobacteria bacterium]|nr:ABC transporter permease [Deltaproteobacteria bacterium]
MKEQVKVTDDWTTVIGPSGRWFDLRLGDIWRYRDLIKLFVRRDFVAVYKQTILGPLWFLLQPLLTTLMFTVVFGRLAKIPTDGMPPFLFYMAGLIPWSYFSGCLNNAANTFVGNAHLFGKVWFPRLTVPIAAVLNNLVTFFIQVLLFLGFYLWYAASGAAISPTLAILACPLLLLQLAGLGLGCGIIVSSLTTRYRDLSHLVSFGVQLWMYATPIVYPSSQIPDRWRWVLAVNPMAPVIEQFRHALLGTPAAPAGALLASAIATVILLLIGVVLFTRVEKSFVDTV